MNKNITLWLGMLCWLAHLVGCATVDYAYRHHIAGKVVDQNGNPVIGASVMRIFDGVQPADIPAFYKTVTDQHGAFDFVYTGLGGKPKAHDSWKIEISCAGFKTQSLELAVPWVPFDPANKEYGYINLELRVRLQR